METIVVKGEGSALHFAAGLEDDLPAAEIAGPEPQLKRRGMSSWIAGRSRQTRRRSARQAAEVIRLLELRVCRQSLIEGDIGIKRPVGAGKAGQRRPDEIAVGIVLRVAARASNSAYVGAIWAA